jgi:hypothetical protein
MEQLNFASLTLAFHLSSQCIWNALANYFHPPLVKSLMHPENPRAQNAGKLLDNGAACKLSPRTANRKVTHQAQPMTTDGFSKA